MHAFLEFSLFLFAGFISNLYGTVVGGGGLVKFPVMIFLGVPIDIAIGTNKVALVFGDASGAWSFYKKNLVSKRAFKLAVVTIPLAAIGSFVVAGVDEDIVNILVASSLIVLLFLLPTLSRIEPIEFDKKPTLSLRSLILLVTATALFSFYAGFYGVGFGTFIIFTFIFTTKSPFLEACANARVLSLATSVVSSIIFMQKGLVDYAIVLPLAIGSVVGARFGVNAATKLDAKWIKIILSISVLASAVKLLATSF